MLALAGGVLGATALDVLHDARGRAPHVLAGVLAGPDRGGRRPCPWAASWAAAHGVPLLWVPDWAAPDAPDRLRAAGEVDLLLSLAYDRILPAWALARAARAVNLHRGLAPEFRGCYSTTWALAHGAAAAGATLHLMVPDVDAGPVLARAEVAIRPEDTAAEVTPRVERAALDLLAAHLPGVLGDMLPAVPQAPGGRTYPRVLPPHEVPGEEVPRLADRVRALHHPPHPPVRVTLGARRFAVVPLDDGPPGDDTADLGAAPAPVPPGPATGVPAGLRHGLPALAFADVAGAVAHALRTAGRPVALPGAVDPAVLAGARATGLELRPYELDDRLAPDPASLAAAAGDDALVLVPCPFGRPADPAALTLAAARGLPVLEDRSRAALLEPPPAGLAVVGLRDALAVPDGALLVHAHREVPVPAWAAADTARVAAWLAAQARRAEGEAGWDRDLAAAAPDPAPRPMSRWSAAALRDADLPAARLRTEAVARDLAAALAPLCPVSHWPLGAAPGGYPLVLPGRDRVLGVLRARGIGASMPLVAVPGAGSRARHLARHLLALPCHGGLPAGAAAPMLAALAAAGVDALAGTRPAVPDERAAA